MAIAFDDDSPSAILTSSGTSLTSGSSLTVGAGSDRALFGFLFTGFTATSAHAMKWRGSGGTALTQIGSTVSLNNIRASAWQLIAPASATDTAYGSWTTATSRAALAELAYTGVDQTTPNGSLASATGTVSNSFGFDASVVITTVVGDLVLCFFGVADNNGATPLMTPNGTPTPTARNEGEELIFSYATTEVVATGTSTTVQCGVAPTSSNISGDWCALAFVIQAAAGGGPASNIIPGIAQRNRRRSWMFR